MIVEQPLAVEDPGAGKRDGRHDRSSAAPMVSSTTKS